MPGAIRCAVVLIPFGGAADKIKNPAEWPGRGLRPAATPGEEMQPRIQPTNAVLRPRFRQRSSEVPYGFLSGEGNTLFAFCRTTP
jgi:hypothetical protein